MGKRGAVNWTVGKLINIVLLVMVLALVIYGISSGGLNPLMKNLEQKFEEGKYFLDSIFGRSSIEECYSASVVGMGGGRGE